MRQIIERSYRAIGFLIDDFEEFVLLVDPRCLDGVIVGASRGFERITGYSRGEVLGQNCRMMLEGVPEFSISRSARKNLRDYCRMCLVDGLEDIAEVHSLQPNRRKDGSVFLNLFVIRACAVRGRLLVISCATVVGEGVTCRATTADRDRALETLCLRLRAVRAHLRAHASISDTHEELRRAPPDPHEDPSTVAPEFRFFAERLQDHALLTNRGYTAVRREAEELAYDCLVFGQTPVRPSKDGLSFKVRIDQVTSAFSGLPILGFTRRAPSDDPGLFPCVSRCLGASVLIGACGEAFARDSVEHFKMGFKTPQHSEVETWSHQPDTPPQHRTLPVCPRAGDVLRCLYTWSGSIQLFFNDRLILSFETRRPIDSSVAYYAVVDVCLSVHRLTLLPSTPTPASAPPTPAPRASSETKGTSGQAGTGDDAAGRPWGGGANDSIDAVVRNSIIRRGLVDAAASCDFCVTIADPRRDDCPLIAVSKAFEITTGYSRNEAVGVNCRFLNDGCDFVPEDLVALRAATETGAPFTAILTNRKKSGELFLNLLDMRGLTIARDPVSGKELWFLVGIQADVTHMAEDEIPNGHLSELHRVAENIRAAVSRELSEFVRAGAAATLASGSTDDFELLDSPEWRMSPNSACEVPRSTGDTGTGAAAELCSPLAKQLGEDVARRSPEAWLPLGACIAIGAACVLAAVMVGRNRRAL